MFKVRDIVLIHPEFGGGISVIVDIRPNATANPYLMLDGRKLGKKIATCKGAILRKLGELPADDPLLNPSVAAQVAQDPRLQKSHEQFCSTMESLMPDQKAKWAYLGGLKPGDPVTIAVFGRSPMHYTFVRVLHGGQRFHFVAENASNTAYKFTIVSLQLPITETAPAVKKSRRSLFPV